ncbi:SAM-dependent methyltransferase [Legionella spiritensis]|uniref:SAM-dependent methyltransferase n=1 Tax=Legionella spiritensis TaxID=452 RepID=UPI000F6BBB64|nr:SAM-dependent methyltransferase [Legionella spiritensis]VEG91209.1 tetrapyrrole methylase [Legionella spiritensis]
MPKLLVVGSGIKSVAHLTEETKRVIQNADKVLYLVNEEHLKAWITREAKISESLESLYFTCEKRIEAYQKITAHIVEVYNQVSSLCVVFYGHPAVFADSALNAVKIIQSQGGDATILPAVSSMDCLFSDLQIDPGNHGCFLIDATELLIYERNIDVHAHLILWQVANLGTFDRIKTTKLPVLVDYLSGYYPKEHPACIYEASILPTQQPRMEWTTIGELDARIFKAISMLYLPPLPKTQINSHYLSLLDMNEDNFVLSAQLHTSPE